MDPAQLLHVVMKQAGKLYFRFTWSQTQRQFFTLCCPYTCIHSKAAPVRATSQGGGGTLKFSHIRRLGPFFGGFKILNFHIFGGFQKNEYFFGVLRFCGYFLGVITKLG